MTGAYLLWRVLITAMWFGVMFAVCTVVIAVALVAVLLAVASGVVMPSRTVRGQLQALDANACEGIARIRALRPS